MTAHPHAIRSTTLHRLRRHQFLRLQRPRGVCVRAERGSLWVTIDGHPADIELAPGASHVFDGTSAVVVGTLGGDAVASTTVTAGTSWVQRLLEWLGRGDARVPA